MEAAQTCLICDGNSLRQQSAVFAPFIAKRIWSRPPFPVNISRCDRCNFAFADCRFSPEEEHRLYSGYRTSEYQIMRESVEPWYTEKFNASLSTGTMEKRRIPVARILREHLPSNVTTVLDFGGDRGDLFDGLIPGAATYVFDISGIDAAPGVKPLGTLDECASLRPDLIGCSNVLEHVTSPTNFLGEIRSVCAEHSLVFIEVPCDDPFSFVSMAKRTAQETALALARPRLALSLLPLKFLFQVHEHVSFFTLPALEKLMQASGFKVLSSGLYPSEGYSFGPYKLASMKAAWCIAKA